MKKLLFTLYYFCALLLTDQALAWNEGSMITQNETLVEDSILISASQRYGRLTPLKWFFMGTNYRKDWSTPVKMPIFHLTTTKGGFTIKKLGGGQQTKSLKLKDKNGNEWVLRTIDKDVKPEALPKSLRKFGVIASIVQDQISAAYPYAPLTITDLSYAANVPVTPNELYYVPSDPALGKYREILAHRVCLLEPEPETIIASKSFSTDKAYKQIREDNRNVVLQENMLRARLLDMLIADWDRHKNQWDWSTIDSNNSKYFYPFPEDRDQAFFHTNGMLSKLIRLFTLPNLIGFNKSGAPLKKLNYKVYSFDRYFMSQLTRNDWERIIKEFQEKVTDAVIVNAVKKLPVEIYAFRGVEIQDKLITRKNNLYKNALDYYDFITSVCTVNGTSMSEVYKINYRGNDVDIEVFDQQDNRRLFSRTYHAANTKEIQFWDYSKDNDRIETKGAPNAIKLVWLEPKPIDKESNKF